MAETTHNFIDTEGEIFSTTGGGTWRQDPTIRLSVLAPGDDESTIIEFFASDAETIIDLIKKAAA